MSTSEAPIGRPLTHWDLADTPDDGNRWEIIDGEVYVSAFPSPWHQQVATALTSILFHHVRTNKLGRVYAAGLKVVLDEPTGVGPDIVYISAARMHLMQDDGFHGAPDLVVEVLSSKPGLDRLVKFRKYAQSGIPYYWMIDPASKTLWAFRLVGDGYREETVVQGYETFRPDLFADLEIDLSLLWG